jgi:hypothetical protein
MTYRLQQHVSAVSHNCPEGSTDNQRQSQSWILVIKATVRNKTYTDAHAAASTLTYRKLFLRPSQLSVLKTTTTSPAYLLSA